MNKSTILSLIQHKFGGIKYTGDTDQINVNCLYCVGRGLTPNTTYKLSINLQIKKIHCFRCDFGGDLSLILPQLAILPITEVVPIKPPTENILEGIPGNYQYLDKLEYPWNELVYKFLHDKGFDSASLKQVVFVPDYIKGGFSFGPRLMFPIYQSDEYRGFQGRTIYKNTDPKYIGATGMLKGELLYNYDKAFSQRYMLVITEGFFDCLKVGDRAVATLGKNITKKQLRLIQLGVFDKVVVFLDKDAEKEAYANAKSISNYFETYVAMPNWENLLLLPDGKKKKDPGDMTKMEINDVLKTRLERVY
jgi:hypothetical protein